eukprot:scaffold591_cov121-Isochrysis_galbana.AAC.8
MPGQVLLQLVLLPAQRGRRLVPYVCEHELGRRPAHPLRRVERVDGLAPRRPPDVLLIPHREPALGVQEAAEADYGRPRLPIRTLRIPPGIRGRLRPIFGVVVGSGMGAHAVRHRL